MALTKEQYNLWYQKNKERQEKYKKEWREKNKDRVKEYQKISYERMRDKLPAIRKAKREAMTPEEKTAVYKKYKHHNTPMFMQAAGQQHRIKKFYPEALKTSDILNTRALETWIKEKWNQPCKYCGSPSNTVDHIIPISAGGSHTWANIQLICDACNTAKHDMPEQKFLAWIDSLIAVRSMDGSN